jgi:putative FmdB family regulatory protein
VPIYEFICEACGYEFEKIQTFSATTMPACMKCQSEQVTRRMSRPAIHFKGSGWYITDSKKSSKSATSGEQTNGGKKEGESSDSGKAESTVTESSVAESSKPESEKAKPASEKSKVEPSKSAAST